MPKKFLKFGFGFGRTQNSGLGRTLHNLNWHSVYVLLFVSFSDVKFFANLSKLTNFNQFSKTGFYEHENRVFGFAKIGPKPGFRFRVKPGWKH